MRLYLIVSILVLWPVSALPTIQAQDQLSQLRVIEEEGRLWVEGTSNRDDWVVHAAQYSGSIFVSGSTVDRVELSVPSADITSNESTIMDRLIRSALKANEHPVISYIADEPASDIAGDVVQFVSTGQLTLAGQTRDVAVDVSGERRDDGRFRFSGSAPITMSDFGIRPPVAMFGALRTADNVVVHFDIVAGADSN